MKFYNLNPKTLSVGAKGNRVLKANIPGGFPENWWSEGKADELVKLGFLVEIKEGSEAKKIVKKYKRFISREQLMDILTSWGVEFETDANKDPLYELYEANFDAHNK